MVVEKKLNSLKHLKKEFSVIDNVAELKAIYSTKIKVADRMKIPSSTDSSKLFFRFYEYMEMIEQKEIISAAFLTRSNAVLAIAKIAEGSSSSCIMDTQYLLRLALLSNAQAIIMCHNHPSGNVQPSDTDKRLTADVKSACSLLNISFLDHIILSTDNTTYFSFADEGLM
jgi:DNA repair protein RadC